MVSLSNHNRRPFDKLRVSGENTHQSKVVELLATNKAGLPRPRLFRQSTAGPAAAYRFLAISE